MKRKTGQWVRKAEEDWQGAQELSAREPPLRDLASFHCQQAAEKYLKALLQENGIAFPKTHDLELLLGLLLPIDKNLATLSRGLSSLTEFAVEYRYPGTRATTRRMQSAKRLAEKVRREIRQRLGLTE